MVKHIILWTLNPELSEEEKKAVKAGIKAGLEGLVGKVPGLVDVKVHIDGRLASSNADVMLGKEKGREVVEWFRILTTNIMEYIKLPNGVKMPTLRYN